MTGPQGALLNNLLLFGRLLHRLGLDVNPRRMVDLATALEHIEIGNRSDFYYTSRGLLVHDREDIPLFDQAFELFWRNPQEKWVEVMFGTGEPGKKNPSRPPMIARKPPALPARKEPPLSSSEETEDQRPRVHHTYSDREVLRQKNFAEMNAEELQAIKQLMLSLSLRLGERLTRRRKPGKKELLDLRRSIRKSHAYEGEILVLARKKRKKKPRPIVVIADISGSMERYTKLLLHFIYGLAQDRHHPVEAFVFGTRLTRITRQLQERDVEVALAGVSQFVLDWSGGTRIGGSLKTFNFDWGRRVLGRGAVVILISDGWDRGDADLLGKEMARLQRNCRRLIWLNPHLGSPAFEPLTRGLVTALPYVDDFLPVHNLASLEQLAQHLERLGV